MIERIVYWFLLLELLAFFVFVTYSFICQLKWAREGFSVANFVEVEGTFK